VGIRLIMIAFEARSVALNCLPSWTLTADQAAAGRRGLRSQGGGTAKPAGTHCFVGTAPPLAAAYPAKFGRRATAATLLQRSKAHE